VIDKREVIEFLKQYLSDIPRLAKLDLDNEEYPLWYSKIRDIIEAVFGRDSSEYQDFVRCDWQAPMRRMRMLEGLHRNDYISNLKRIRVALKGIIQKYEILGIEEKPATGPAEAAEDYAEKAAAKELELILEGTPDMVIECITNFVKKLNSEGYAYKSIPRIGNTPDFARWDKTYSARCAIIETQEGADEQIGTIRLTLLPKEQTLLSVPEPEDWGSSFGVFLSYLLGEFKRLRIVYFEEEKPPMGFRLPHKEKGG